MRIKIFPVLLVLTLLINNQALTQNKTGEFPILKNPISVSYLEKKLRESQPRLVFNSTILSELRKKIGSDPVIQNMYEAIALNTNSIFEKPLLTRKVKGRRLLSTSREMLWRINMLGFMYLIEKDSKILSRINDELVAACNFKDWNPSHFLDVAEMSLAVALALDWTAGNLPETTKSLAKKALIVKGIEPSWPENGESHFWINKNNNWNQVCNGGMIAASIAIAEENPDLAAKTIHRALEGLPHALAEYSPDGVYPEGSVYWNYGTSYSVLTAAMLESAFGDDFGHWEYTPFAKSAVFRSLMNAPSGMYYNFADCGTKRSENGDIVLAWFAMKSGNKTFFERDRFMRPPKEMGKLSRLTGAAMAWISQCKELEEEKLPLAWKGEGINPVVIFRGNENDPHHFYLGCKGGLGNISHGNMDGGSFIFELNGVRWSIDPGNQGYHDLEKEGFDLWNTSQDSQRWTLLTKNNFGHSTITVNDQLHRATGKVTIKDFKEGVNPHVCFDMTATLGDAIETALRTFTKESETSLIIEDQIITNEDTRLISWQMMTTADITIVEHGAILEQDGKKLKLDILSDPELEISVISLYPAPLKLDKQMKELKRIEIRVPAWTVKNNEMNMKVRLTGI